MTNPAPFKTALKIFLFSLAFVVLIWIAWIISNVSFLLLLAIGTTTTYITDYITVYIYKKKIDAKGTTIAYALGFPISAVLIIIQNVDYRTFFPYIFFYWVGMFVELFIWKIVDIFIKY